MELDLASLGLLPAIFVLSTIAIGSLIKGITGLGLPLFSIPALALFVPVETAVVVIALPTLVANVWLIVVHREYLASMQKHRFFLAMGFIGALGGTWFLANFDDKVLRILLAVWLGIYLIQLFTGRTNSNLYSGKAGTSGPLGLAAGVLQGATGISAPVIAPYYHAHGYTLSAYAFAVAFTFALFAAGQVSAMAFVDLLTPTLLGYSVIAVMTTIVFMPLGLRLSKRLSVEAFRRFLPVLFVLMEIKLIADIII
jgi:uncharacterized membrane protein YfcA